MRVFSVLLILCLSLVVLARTVDAQQGEGFELTWSAIGHGTLETSTGDGLQLIAGIGQTEASARIAGGDFKLDGGFFSRFHESMLFADGFESGDTSRWSSTAGRLVVSAKLEIKEIEPENDQESQEEKNENQVRPIDSFVMVRSSN